MIYKSEQWLSDFRGPRFRGKKPRDVAAWIGLAADDRPRRFELADQAHSHASELLGNAVVPAAQQPRLLDDAARPTASDGALGAMSKRSQFADGCFSSNLPARNVELLDAPVSTTRTAACGTPWLDEE